MVEVGKKAPSFLLQDQDGEKVSLNDFKGKNIILYFYPKDNTSGCTLEACNFRDHFPNFGRLDAVVLGVSSDSVESHKKFASKYKLPFHLLSDDKKELIEKFDVWKEKSMYGRKYMGVERSTFVIDKTGKVRNIFRKVKVAEHHQELIKALKELT